MYGDGDDERIEGFGTGSPGCPLSWLGDAYCDEACFNEKCHWDRRDCLEKGQTPCGDDCIPSMLADSECDATCNTESCAYDPAPP